MLTSLIMGSKTRGGPSCEGCFWLHGLTQLTGDVQGSPKGPKRELALRQDSASVTVSRHNIETREKLLSSSFNHQYPFISMEKKNLCILYAPKDLLLKQIQYMELYLYNFTTIKTTYDFYFLQKANGKAQMPTETA